MESNRLQNRMKYVNRNTKLKNRNTNQAESRVKHELLKADSPLVR